MATKCVVQIDVPVATAVITSQPKRVTPSLARARRNSRIAIQQPAAQTAPARSTSRRSCSTEMQLKTRSIFDVPLQSH